MRGRTFAQMLRQHPLFAGLLTLQSLFVLLLLADLLYPAAMQEVTLTAADLTQTQTAQQCTLSLPRGAYEMTISYESSGTAPSGQILAEVCVLADAVQSDALVLTDTFPSVTGRFWVTTLGRAENVQLLVTPANGQLLTVQNITLRAQPIWKAAKLLGWLLAFVAADALLLRFRHTPVCEWGTPLLLLSGVLLASLPYCREFLFAGHDLNFHTYRILNLAQSMANGQFPVRLFTRGFNGYGIATPQFYCDLFLYLPALLYIFFVPLQRCFQIYVILVNTATAASAQYSFARISGSKKAAAVAAFCYTLASYRLTNVLVRAAVGEYTAMVFLPLVVLGAWAITVQERPTPRDWLPLSLGMAGLLQSHLLTAEMCALLLVLYCLVRARTLFTRARLAAAVKAALTAVGLSAWFLVPCLDALKNERVMVSGIHPSPLQSTGLGLAELAGLTADPKTGMVLTIGLSGILSLLLALWGCLQKDAQPARDVLRTALPFAVLTLLFSTCYFPWDVLQSVLPEKITDILYKFQFCWRWLSPTAVLLGVLTATGLQLLARDRRLQATAAALLLGLTLTCAGSFYTAYSRTQDRYTRISTDTATAYPLLTMGYDYLPAGTDLEIFSNIQAVAENPAVSADWQGSGLLTCTNPTDTETTIALPLLAYRHYTAQAADGTVLPLSANGAHCLCVTVPAGYNGTVTVRFAEPLLWRLAELVTLATVLALALWRPLCRRTPAREAALAR